MRKLNQKETFGKNLDLPLLAKWKAFITEYGVDIKNPLAFNNYKNIDLYKTKYRTLKPITIGLKVYDQSSDDSIIPAEITIHHEEKASIVKIGYRPNSPIEIEINNNQILIKEKATQKTVPIEVRLVKKKAYQNMRLPKEIDPSEPKLSDFIDIVGLDRMSLMTFDGCWNWNVGKPCQFCDYNPKRKEYRSAKPSTNTLDDFNCDLDKWWLYHRKLYLKGIEYTFRYLLEKEDIGPHKHLLIMSGNLPKPIKTWGIAIDIIGTLNRVSFVGNFDSTLNICPHPSLEHLKKIKELGIRQVQYNLEVIGPKTFKRICPGKIDYSIFKSRLEEAVDIMGFGNVRSNFVLGLQPINQLLRGIENLATKGVVADYSIFQPKRSTPLVNYPPPTIDEIVYFTKKLVEIYKKHNFRGIYCSLSSRSSIINECL